MTFLKQGWQVRGALRDDSKRDAVLNTAALKSYGESGQFTLFATGPLDSADYSEAIKGAQAVIHTASPVEFDPDNFETKHYKPAVEGTRRIMDAAVAEKSVQAVVMTSTLGEELDTPVWLTFQAPWGTIDPFRPSKWVSYSMRRTGIRTPRRS